MFKNLKKKKGKIKRKFVISLVSFLFLLGVISFLTMKPFKEDEFQGKTVEMSEEEKEVTTHNENIEIEKDCKNILLLGVDSREENFSDARTDSIIIATIDSNNNAVKLTSVMRDTMLEVPGKGYYKINSAYSLGGVDLLKRTLKYNFNVNIDTYMVIDFKGFQEVIDTLGGIEVDIKKYEVKEINKYIKDVNGNKATLIADAGMQKLNGQQALSYSRIRKVGNGDFERMDRQKRVIGLILDKAKKMNIAEYPELMNKMYPFIRSDMQSSYILKMANTVYKMQNMELKNFRIPLDNTGVITFVDSQWVVIPKLQQTAKELMKFMYPDRNLTSIKVPDNSFIINKASNQKRKSEEENEMDETRDNGYLENSTGENYKHNSSVKQNENSTSNKSKSVQPNSQTQSNKKEQEKKSEYKFKTIPDISEEGLD